MPSWQLNLLSHSGKQLDRLTQYINSNSHATFFIDGDAANDGTWRFVDYSDETQARRDWISQFTFVGGVFQFSSKIVDTYVLTPPPVQGLVSRVHLPPTADGQQFWVLLRHGDTVEFEVTRARVEVVFDPDSEDPHVQVESSGPGVLSHKIKHEIKEEPDTDDETDDEAAQPATDVRRGTSAEESQHLYSTSREHLSPTPRPTRESQVVKDTPNRRRIRSQHESTIPESLPMEDTNLERSQPTDNDNDNDNGIVRVLPDVNTGELPDTSPTEALRFRVPTQHTPSPSHQSFSTSEVGKLISNLNEDNPPSQVPQSTFSPKKTPRTDVIAGQSSNDSSTTDSAEPTISLEPIELTVQQAESPAIEPVATALEDVASPVNIINDGIINDRNGTTASNDGDAADMEPNPSVTSTSKKRKKVSDSDSVALSTKRAKMVEGDADATGTTPFSTASKRGSGRGKGLETPSGSAPTRSSSRRKSLDEEPPPSTISRRVSTRRKSIDSEGTPPSGSPSKTGRQYRGDPPVILYSNTRITDKPSLMKNLKNQGASKTEDIKSANFLCVGPGELLKTPKLLHSLTLGKTIVTDNWVSHSIAAGVFLDTSEYLPEELKATKHLDRTKIFTDQVIYITAAQRHAYKKGWDDVVTIIKQAGGTNPLTGPLSKLDTSSITLYLGADKDDDVAAKLQEQGETVYKKDILGASIVQGELVLDESLELPPVEKESKATKAEPKSAKKGGRKKKE